MGSHKSDDKAVVDIPEYLIDSKKNVTYKRLRFFGKVNLHFSNILINSVLS